MDQPLAILIAANPEDFTITEVVDVLVFTSDQYHNGEDGESFLDDAQWDGLYRYLQITDPVNKYLIGVGSEVRGGAGEPLPHNMPGLDQVHEGDTEKWIFSNNLGDEIMIAMDKMDGNSGQILYDTEGNLQSGFSRGTSTEGQDWTRHFKRIKNLPTTKVGMDVDSSMAFRIEVEMKDEVFEKLTAQGLLLKRKGKNKGKPYSNPRNYIAGQMNSTEAEQLFYDNVDVIAYEIMFPLMDTKEAELDALNAYGFNVAEYAVYPAKSITDGLLIKRLKERHKVTPWAIDGLVLIPNKRSVRDTIPARKGSSLNPVYAKKFKVGQEDNSAITTIVAIHRKVSSDGYIVPRIEIVPVDLVGVTVTFATAYNELFLQKNNIGVGTEIRIIRSGDVIPKIVEVITPTSYELPDPAVFGEYEWSEPNTDGERVNIVLTDVENSADANQQKLIKFFANLGVEFLAKKSLAKLYDAGFEKPEDIINANVSDIQTIVGEANGRKGMASLNEKLNPVEPWMLAGITPYFGRGIGRRKMKKVYDATGSVTEGTTTELINVEGIGPETAPSIIDGFDEFVLFLSRISGKYTFATPQEAAGSDWEGQVVTFTGFRDKDAQAKIEAQGGRIGSSVSSKTTLVVTQDPNSTSSKIVKAKDLGIEVIDPDELYKRIA